MGRSHVFADEAGNFDFSRGSGASKFFILTTVTMGHDCHPGQQLLELRRDLPWQGIDQRTEDFHATEEAQEVRDRVFDALRNCDFRVDASIWEKPKVAPHLVSDTERFYKTVAYFHFKKLLPSVSTSGDELMVAVASIGTKKRRSAYKGALDDVIRQAARGREYKVGFWSAASDPCLWVADYCSWAIQRKWERGDDRSHRLIVEKIWSEFELTRSSSTVYY